MPVPSSLLANLPFLKPLTDAERTKLARAMTRVVLPAGTLLFREGDPGDLFYLVLKGEVEIFSGAGERENRLNLLCAGEWFGELALIDDQPRSGSARTLTRAVVLALPRAEFRWLVTTYPVALYSLVSMTQQRLRDRDRAFEAESRLRVAQLEQLHQTALSITQHLDRASALEAIRERAVDLLHSTGGEIHLNKSSPAALAATDDHLSPPFKRAGRELSGRVWQSCQPAHATRRGVCHMLAAPIRLVDPAGNERRLGVLTVYRAAGDTPFQAADETLLQLFASQAAIVIENTELHQTRLDKERLDTELNDARRVQTSLIPAHPLAIKGYQIAGLWHPAKQVSGDYYDYIRLDDGRVAFVIADVSGKGLDAALFMANTRSILRANAALGGSPDEIIFRTNNAVTADSSRGMFVTAFFGILDPLRRRFSYVNAGHNLPLWRHAATRTIQTLAGGNLALGIMAGIKFQAHELELQPRDLILLYTDGITEATDATGALYGMARLRQVLAASGDLRARQVIRTLDRSVREFTGAAPQSDDITVVGLGRV